MTDQLHERWKRLWTHMCRQSSTRKLKRMRKRWLKMSWKYSWEGKNDRAEGAMHAVLTICAELEKRGVSVSNGQLTLVPKEST